MDNSVNFIVFKEINLSLNNIKFSSFKILEIKYLTHDGSVAYKYKGGFVEGKESGMGVQTHYNRDGSVQYKHDGVWENGKFKGIKIPNTHFLKTETQDERRKYYDSLYPGLKKIKLPPTPEL